MWQVTSFSVSSYLLLRCALRFTANQCDSYITRKRSICADTLGHIAPDRILGRNHEGKVYNNMPSSMPDYAPDDHHLDSISLNHFVGFSPRLYTTCRSQCYLYYLDHDTHSHFSSFFAVQRLVQGEWFCRANRLGHSPSFASTFAIIT